MAIKGLFRASPRTQSLLLCLLTFSIGIGLISAHLRWDIPSEVTKNRLRPKTTPPAKPPASSTVTPVPVTPSGPVTASPVPISPDDEDRQRNALLNQMGSAWRQLETLEAEIRKEDQPGQLAHAGHFFLTKPKGDDLDEALRSGMMLRVSFTAVPQTEVLLSQRMVRVYQPSRKFAVIKPVEKAFEDWLTAYMELTGNIDIRILDAGNLSSQKPASFSIVPRQPKNIRRAVIFVDLRTHLPVRFEIEFPLRKQISALVNLKPGQPIDQKVFTLTLPAGMGWTSQ